MEPLTGGDLGAYIDGFSFQVRFLQQQAKSILEEASLNNQLHHIACNFKKVPGKIYYVYKRDNGKNYMSMISPEVKSITISNFMSV